MLQFTAQPHKLTQVQGRGEGGKERSGENEWLETEVV